MPSPPLSIVQSLSPRIAVLTSDDVISTCEANGCRGLEELLRPWEGGTERVSILSSTLTPTIHPTFPLRFVSYSSVFPLPETSSPNADVVIDLIGSYVGARKPEEEQHYPLTRSLLLSTRPTAGHETFNHPVGILLAISTSTPEPLETLQRLVGRATGPMSQAVPWLDGVNIMRFFVVVHDVSKLGEDTDMSQQLLSSVKKIYGPHSTLLVVNSQHNRNAPPLSPDTTTHPSIPMARPFTPENVNPSALSQVYASALSSLTLSPSAAASLIEDGETPASPTKPPRRKLYGAKLTAEDTQRLAALVRELVVQSLVPWMEARVREWNEVWQSNRRGITGRLFGAGRKFFSSRPSSPAPNAAGTGYNAVKGYYPIVAVEALTRRLGDFAFMLRDYRFASTVYDSLRRDFAQDRAWRYAAAATEMYGLSLLLAHTYFNPATPPTPPSNPFTTLQHTDISSWLEQAVVAYQGRGPANQIQLDALRITVLYYEAWRAIGEWRGVGPALVRAAGDADEVPSAVMIEEAASADVRGGKSGKGKRRRAFHLVLAARRYETAGLKTFSRRCLERAAQTYRDAPWTAAQDRIEYSLGRQAYTLGQSDVAVEHFLRLLRKEETGVPGSQGGVLEDMALAYEQLAARPDLLQDAQEKLQLPTPIFDVKATRIVLPTSHASSSGTSDDWAKLEHQALASWDRKGKKPMSLLPDPTKIVAAVDETFHIELVAQNPLNSSLVISDIHLTSSPANAFTVTTPVSDITLEPYETQVILIPVVVTSPSAVTIDSVNFLFHKFFPCTQSLTRKGKRLYGTKAQRINPTYGKDSTLTVDVGRPRPRLRLDLIAVPEEVYAGEQVEISLQVENTGKVAVDTLQVVLNETLLRKRDILHNDTMSEIPNVTPHDTHLALLDEALQPGQTTDIPLTLSSTLTGRIDLLALAIFANAEDANDISAVTLAHSLHVSPLVEMRSAVRPGRQSSREYLVGVEIVNSSASIVTIDGITPISNFWLGDALRESMTLHANQSGRFTHKIKGSAKPSKLDLQQQAVVDGLSKLLQGQTEFSDLDLSRDAKLASPVPAHILQPYLSSLRASRATFLQAHFPTVPLEALSRLFPQMDPLDLDFAVSWTIRGDEQPRKGVSILHGTRVGPEFSLVEGMRRQIEEAITLGGKTTRTMYEETGRLRQVLMVSVLDGVLSQEDDPLEVVITTYQGRRIQVDTKEGTVIQIRFSLRNRSPALAARWILDLPESNSQQPGLLPAAQFAGTLSYRGQLSAFEAKEIDCSIWVNQSGLIGITGWTLRVETGDLHEDGAKGEMSWTPRRQWTRRGESDWIEVVQ